MHWLGRWLLHGQVLSLGWFRLEMRTLILIRRKPGFVFDHERQTLGFRYRNAALASHVIHNS